MAINKVVYGADTLIDLSEDTVTENDVLSGATFHSADGEQRTGTVVTAPINDTGVSSNEVWSSYKTKSMLDKWHISQVGGNIQEVVINSGDVGEREITFNYTYENMCYRLFADTTDGSIVTIKSSSFEHLATTSSGIRMGNMTYVVNVKTLPVKFRLREFEL